MKPKRNLIQIFLLSAGMLPTVMQAQYNYTISNGDVTITRYTGSGGAVIIPDTIGGEPVTAIGASAFEGSSVTSITMTNTVLNIGDYAFASCTFLTSVIIGNSVTNIGDYAFEDCYWLSGVYFQGDAPNIGASVFNLANDATIYYLEGTKGWGATFGGRPTVEILGQLSYTTNNGTITITGWTTPGGAVTIPSMTNGLPVTSIASGAFADCYDLSSVTIPDSVTNIGSSAFSLCYSLTNVTIGSSVTIIGDFAFYSCVSLANFMIPNSVANIGDFAFFDCADLTAITGSGVASIGNSAFLSCTSLTNVNFGNSVTNIAAYAFFYCTNLTSISFQGNIPTSVGSDLFDYDSNAIVYYLPGSTGWGLTFAGPPDCGVKQIHLCDQ